MDEDRLKGVGKQVSKPSNPALESFPAASTDQSMQVVESQLLPLHAEAMAVSKRIRRTLVRAMRTTQIRDVHVAEDLAREQVVVERVAVGKVVDGVPPIRQEGDVTIVSVVEEEVVVIRRLVLKEEVRLRRVSVVKRFTETVPLREQQVTVTRTELKD